MTDTPSARPAAGAPAAGIVPAHVRGASYALLGVFVAALGFGLWGLWQTVIGGAPRTGVDQAQVEALAQQVATLTRSDQNSRDANRDPQGKLAQRDDDIAALRADGAIYVRLRVSTRALYRP